MNLEAVTLHTHTASTRVFYAGKVSIYARVGRVLVVLHSRIHRNSVYLSYQKNIPFIIPIGSRLLYITNPFYLPTTRISSAIKQTQVLEVIIQHNQRTKGRKKL